MQRNAIITFFFATTFSLNCMCQQSHDSITVDINGDKNAIKLFADGNLWTTTNLNLRIAGSYCYENEEENCIQFGRLYVFKSAKEGCKLLGDGWGLPTKDEWYKLGEAYSSGAKDSMEVRKNAYQMLLANGGSLFNALLGGGRDLENNYTRINAHGFYWTSTETDSLNACFANFAKGAQALFMQDEGEKGRAFSVRCVKSVK